MWTKIDLTGWSYKGTIDPLIRSAKELVAVTDADGLKDAVQTMRLELSYGTKIDIKALTDEDVMELYFIRRAKPMWSFREPIVGELRTLAQVAAVHARGAFRVECEDLTDLQECIGLTVARKNFDPVRVGRGMDAVHKECWREGTLYHYDFAGGEGLADSVAIYVKWTVASRVNAVLDRECRAFRHFDRDDFCESCLVAGNQMRADESCSIEDCVGDKPAWRFGWDGLALTR